jgi:predicted ATPase/DNA-binding CsgD family transcriptional regulator
MPGSLAKRRHNLPASRVRLIGREPDLVDTRQTLLASAGRVLTLTGTGGCGKTRLALQLAADLVSEFPDGVWLVELAAITDASLVPAAMLTALGVRERPGESLLATLQRTLSTRRTLIVLDNCEHVIDVCAEVVVSLVDSCHLLSVLATSREALRIPGEKTWRVPSLAVPHEDAGLEEIARTPAVQLFVERAQASVPGFTLETRGSTIGGICRRLDGLPLAIELAAARVQAMGVDQILERLGDSIHLLIGGSRTAPTRQQTLRAALDWSYGLLDDKERIVFRRLAVFAEGCDLDAAESVCSGGDVVESEVLDLLTRLIDKSLVVVGDQPEGNPRYRLLEPVRQFADERLLASGERNVVRQRHTWHYLSFAEARSYDTNIGGARRFAATRELAREYPNIRGALAWSVATGGTQLGLRLAGSLLFFWQIFGSASEGITWVETLLAMPGATAPTAARAWVLLAAAYLESMRSDDVDSSWRRCQEALQLAQRLNEPLLEWMALLFSGVNRFGAGALEAADDFVRRAAECAGAPASASLGIRGLIACEQAEFARAELYTQQSLSLAKGDAWIEVAGYGTLGRAALGQGALDRARAALEAGLAIARREDEPPVHTVWVFQALGEVDIALGRLDDARAWLARALELQQRTGQRATNAATLDGFAALAAKRGQLERAVRLDGAAEATYESLGVRRTPAETQKVAQWLPAVRQRLGEEAADRAWAEGRALGLDAAIALALNEDQRQAPLPSAAPSAFAAGVLTAREQEVAVLLARGLTNREIGDELVISAHTAQRHVENILSKLGLGSRTQVAVWAVGQGLAAAPAPEAST